MAFTVLSGIAVLWYGGHRVMDGALSIGELVFFHSLLGYLLDPLERLASVNMQLQDALVAVERLGQITDLPTERLDETDKVQFTGVETAIELRSITFGYGCRSNVLEQFSMQIPRGKTIAIISESGSAGSFNVVVGTDEILGGVVTTQSTAEPVMTNVTVAQTTTRSTATFSTSTMWWR